MSPYDLNSHIAIYVCILAIFTLWFGLVAIFLWLILIISVWRTVVYEKDITRMQRKTMYLFSWGIPAILVIYAISIDALGYDGFSFLSVSLKFIHTRASFSFPNHNIH